MKKKAIGIGTIMLGMLCLTGCNDVTSQKEVQSLKIGVCIYDQYDTFISAMMEDLSEAAREKEKETGKAITLEVVGAGGKQNVQNDQVETFIDQGYDILCVNLVDRTDASMIIDKAKNADVPVIFFNRELVQEDLERWDKLYYVGADALESGIMQAEIVLNLCSDEEKLAEYDWNGDGKLQYVMLEGEAGHQDALLRTEYSVNTIIEGGIPMEKLGDEIANWSRAQAQTKTNLWLSEFGQEIELVLANNDDMALGVLDAYREAGITKLPMILGIDGLDEALEAVEDGSLTGTVINDAEGQAQSMLELAYSLVCGTPLPDDITMTDDTYIRLPHTIVTKESK